MDEGIRGRIEAQLAGRPSRGLVVGLSGGLDSSVLLDVLQAVPRARARGLRALHVHHGLHADADAWSAHCSTLCRRLGIALEIVHVEVATDSGLGLEGAARAARHAAFEATLGDDEVLVLAHHADDQAETFLLRALRASGDGLGAMPAWRRYGRGWLWRPMLDLPRSALQAHATQAGLAWCEDPGNADLARDRNYLRHRVLPLLRARWPHADAALGRSAGLAAADRALLEAGDARCLAQAATLAADTLRVDVLLTLPIARRARVLRHWVGALGLPPLPAQGVADLLANLAREDDAPGAGFAWAGARIRRWRNLLHAGAQVQPLDPDWSADWDGATDLRLPTGDGIGLRPAAVVDLHHATPATRFPAPLRVHARVGGERIVLPRRRHSHSLKNVLQALGVPPWERTCLPLLSDDDGQLQAVADLVHGDRFGHWLRDTGQRLLWSRARPAMP